MVMVIVLISMIKNNKNFKESGGFLLKIGKNPNTLLYKHKKRETKTKNNDTGELQIF